MSFALRKNVLITAAVLGMLGFLLPGVASASGRMRLGGAVPSWASPANLRGVAASSGTLDVQVDLGWRNTKALSSLVASVSDPTSPDYAHYLSPARFRSEFSPSSADVAQVSSWLKSQGLTVRTGPTSHLWVEATGTVAEVDSAFATKLEIFSENGRLHRAPTTAPSVPASLQGIVQGVVGLDNGSVQPAKNAPPPPSLTTSGTPCSSYWGEQVATDQPPAYGGSQPYSPCGYTPQQLQGAYGMADAISSGDDGAGVNVAIVDAYDDPTLVSDLQTYSTDHGLAAPDISVHQMGSYHGSPSLQQGWYGEQALDVEAVHSMAPGAHIVYVGALNQHVSGLSKAIGWILDTHAADMISDSWGHDNGSTESSRRQYEALFQQAVSEGIGVYFSTGDDGDEVALFGKPTVTFPSSSPLVTAVGGTSLAVGDADQYLFETGWGTSKSTLSGGSWQPDPPGDFVYGAGGGVSKIYAEPTYQAGVVPSGLAIRHGGPGRVTPDIAADADPNTGFLIGQTQTYPGGSVHYGEYRIGGTSLACPVVAGIMALAQEHAGFDLGFINPALYAAYAGDPSIVNDVQDPPSTVAAVRADWVNFDPSSGQMIFSLRTMDQTGALHTTPGYDDVTGVGSPNGQSFLDAFQGGGE